MGCISAKMADGPEPAAGTSNPVSAAGHAGSTTSNRVVSVSVCKADATLVNFEIDIGQRVEAIMQEVARLEGTPVNMQELYCINSQDEPLNLSAKQEISSIDRPTKELELMLVVLDQPLKWNTARHGQDCVFSQENSTVQVKVLRAGRSGAIGLASFSEGDHSFAFTGSSIREAQCFVGVATQNALTADCDALGEWAYRIDLYAGRKKEPGTSRSAGDYSTYHRGKIRGDCLAVRLRFDDKGKASIEFVLDGKSLGVAFKGVPGPLYPCFFIANGEEIGKTCTLCADETWEER